MLPVTVRQREGQNEDVTFLCYFHNIVASANYSSYLSIEARDELKHLVAGSLRSLGRVVFDLFSNFKWIRSNEGHGNCGVAPGQSLIFDLSGHSYVELVF